MSEDPAQETVQHLRGAALELIAAARAMLDLTEEMVKDPGPLLALAASVAAAARAAASSPAASSPTATSPTATNPDAPGERAQPSPRVQHIRVS